MAWHGIADAKQDSMGLFASARRVRTHPARMAGLACFWPTASAFRACVRTVLKASLVKQVLELFSHFNP